MPRFDIDKAQASDMSGTISDVTVDKATLDGATGSKETVWFNSKWTQQLGYFNSIPDLKSALILKTIWTVGKGYEADIRTKTILETIKGYGKDTFRDILFNMDLIRKIGGDSYAEIIRDSKGNLINLKPLDPGTMRIVVDEKGIIKRYEQVSKNPKSSKVIKFQPQQIFHLTNNRIGDQIHGISDIDALEDTIVADNESFVDTKKIMHFGARPLILWKLKTDDTSKIASFVSKIDAARNLGEDMFIPDDEDVVSHEIVQTTPSPAIFNWRDDLRNKFYRAIGLPQVVPGAGGQSTESESKVIYLAFERIVHHEQKYIEDQIWQQLYLKIKLIPPATLSANLQQDQGKDVMNAAQPSDLTAGEGR